MLKKNVPRSGIVVREPKPDGRRVVVFGGRPSYSPNKITLPRRYAGKLAKAVATSSHSQAQAFEDLWTMAGMVADRLARYESCREA